MRIGLLLTLFFTLQLSACGFHLRGNSQVVESLNPLYIVAGQLEPAQLILIQKQLVRSGARLTPSEQGSNQIQIKLVSLKNRKIASSSISDVELVQLRMNLLFSVMTESGDFLFEQQELVESVEIELDNANVLAHEQTINRARLGLQRRLIQNMIGQLGRQR